MNNHIKITAFCRNCKQKITFNAVKASLGETFVHEQCQDIMRIVSVEEME